MVGTDFTTLVAGVLAVIILVDVSVLVISGRPVPELLSNLAFGVFGFYFGRRAPTAKSAEVRPEAEANG
ncbi:MAG: hypothetical protein ACRDI2_09730 [Chloroflexota bacterium]